jgi:hypothetical protein
LSARSDALVAVVVASAIGFFAVGLVGAVLRDRGPIGVAPGELRGQPQSAADVPAVQATFSYDAGSVTVECRGASVVLLAFAPAAGWMVVEPEMGPDEDVDLTFRGAETFAVDVYCNEGRPRAVLGG